ncbi:unnamed protein product [Rotaria magnacalcarata]|uniref:Uncharacterized protein n=2 Tax=Rotaria magnacalcarata TaxID=392030 RepID=A0A816B1L7_9BILA|nr:unnamed protein product [Rotaria magnacalcarata]
MLDYILVNRKFRNSIQDVRVHRGATGGIGTDHHLSRAKVRLHLKCRKKTTETAQHVAAFEKDLCQLVEKLKEFTGLDIYGEILREKVEPYRLMVQARFPNSRINVEISRFRLWL